MKILIILLAAVSLAVCRPAGETYNPQYDNFNADELVENVRLLKNYGKCFLGEGPCTAEGADFKRVIPEALKTSCAKCTPKQRQLIRKVVHGFQEKLPDMWERLVQKQDPNGEFKENFDRFLHSTD